MAAPRMMTASKGWIEHLEVPAHGEIAAEHAGDDDR